MKKNKNRQGEAAGLNSLNQMIRRIIFYRKKNLVLFFLLLFVSMLLIAGYLLYDYTDRAMKKSDGERLYGTFDICVLADSSEVEDAILSNDEILEALTVKKQVSDWNWGETAAFFITDAFDQFFRMTNCEFVAGRYPTQAGELLCEDEFLSLNGYYFDRDGEVDVEINGETWHVTGTFQKNESLRDAYYVYSPTFLAVSAAKEEEQSAETWLYLDVGDAVTGDVMEEIGEACSGFSSTVGSGVSDEDSRNEDIKSGSVESGERENEDLENENNGNWPQMYANNHYLDSTNLDSYGNTTLPWLKLQQILGYVIVVLLLYLLLQIAWLSLKEKKHDFAVLMSHGVTAGKITEEYARILLFAVLADIAAVLAAAFLCFLILTGGWKFQALFTEGRKLTGLFSDHATSEVLFGSSTLFAGDAGSDVSVSGSLYGDVSFLSGAWRILAVNGIFGVLVISVVLFRCHRLLSANIGRNISATLANRDSIRAKSPKRRRKPKRIFDGEPRLIPPLADNMMQKKRGAYRLFSISIILGLLMIDLYSYVVGVILPGNYVTDYDYRVKYIYHTGQEIMLGIDGMDETYERIQNSGLADLLPLFRVKTRLNFRVTDLEKKAQTYLKNSDEAVAQALSAGKASADVDCIVLGVDAEILEKLCGIQTENIAETDCYVLAGIEEESGRTIRLGLEAGAVIRLTGGVTVEHAKADDSENTGILEGDRMESTETDEGDTAEGKEIADSENLSETGEVVYELTVRGVAEGLNAMQDEFFGKPVVMVSMSVYEALAYENYGFTYPTWLYLNCADGVSDSELTDYFRSLSNILLVDNASEVRDARGIWFRTMVPVYFMGACLLVSLLVNVYIALNSSYEENRSQLAMLSALGVNERGLISLQLRLNWRVFFRSVVLGNALAAGACYLIFRFLIEYDTYVEFLPPCGIMIATTVLVTAVFIGVSTVMRKKIRSMNMVEELSAEAS